MTLLLTREAKKKKRKIKMLPLTKLRVIESRLARKIKAPMHDMINDIIEFLTPFAKAEALEMTEAKESFYMPNVNKIADKYKNDIFASVREETRASTKAAAIYTAQTFKTPFDARFYNQYVEPVIMSRKFKIVTTTITNNIENHLKGGLLAMLKKGATAKQTISYFKELKTNYRTIARTEVLSAANQSSFAMASKEADEVGIKNLMTKTWNVTNINERHWNAGMNGVTIGFNEFFNVNGEQAQYPQDPALSAANYINCQCYMTREIAQ